MKKYFWWTGSLLDEVDLLHREYKDNIKIWKSAEIMLCLPFLENHLWVILISKMTSDPLNFSFRIYNNIFQIGPTTIKANPQSKILVTNSKIKRCMNAKPIIAFEESSIFLGGANSSSYFDAPQMNISVPNLGKRSIKQSKYKP